MIKYICPIYNYLEIMDIRKKKKKLEGNANSKKQRDDRDFFSEIGY